MRKTKYPFYIVCAAALILSAHSGMACEYPEKVPVPDGHTAGKQEMIESINAMKEWQEELAVYRKCIEEEHQASKDAIDISDPVEKEAQIAAMDRQFLLKYNASVDDEAKLGAEFNEQIKIYNKKNKEE